MPTQSEAGQAVVGTYRLLRQDMAERHDGFYSAAEFDIGALIGRHRDQKFLELGRSCVLPPYRNKRTVELLWHGIWTYVLQHRVDSDDDDRLRQRIDGIDPDKLALPLSFLHHYARAPEPWRTAALPRRYVAMDRIAEGGDRPARRALHALPPLIKRLPAARRRHRRRRGDRPAIRHHRRAHRCCRCRRSMPATSGISA